jgi:hypothetical protein
MNFYTDFNTSSQIVIDSLKYLLYTRHPDIFSRVDFEDDKIFEEPLLFTYITQDENKWLDSIIYGYEKSKKDKIEVFSNSEGTIYIPNYGYLLTGYPNFKMQLLTTDVELTLTLDNKSIPFEFEPILILQNKIEIIKYQHPLFEKIFTAGNTENCIIEINGIYKPHIESFTAGLNIISRCNPIFYKALKMNLKKIILFSAKTPNSFVDMKMHNMICLNVNAFDTEFFFVDHISHEGAHLTFNTLTYESKNDFFTVPFDTPFSEATGQNFEHSTIYLRFHGIYTYYEIMKTLEKVILTETLTEEKMHETKGRFIFHLHAFALAIESFEKLDVFKEDGLKLFNYFRNYYSDLAKRYNSWKKMYLFNEQPYDFNLEIFKRQNKIT